MLLVQIMEECDELSQRCSKALRFGLDEVQDGQNQTNLERLLYEFNDLVATVQYFSQKETEERFDIFDSHAQGLKYEKLDKYLAYSKEKGILKDD